MFRGIVSLCRYRGGEVFNFRGDDDVWVFINKALVVDLGGVHGAMEGRISLDTLNLTTGKNYEPVILKLDPPFKMAPKSGFEMCFAPSSTDTRVGHAGAKHVSNQAIFF